MPPVPVKEREERNLRHDTAAAKSGRQHHHLGAEEPAGNVLVKTANCSPCYQHPGGGRTIEMDLETNDPYRQQDKRSIAPSGWPSCVILTIKRQ